MSTFTSNILSQIVDINTYYLAEENEVEEPEVEEKEVEKKDDNLKIRENLDFISEIGLNFISNIVIGAIMFVYVLFTINYLYLFWQFIKLFIWGSNYLFGLLWDSLDKGQEWLQIAVIVSSIAATLCTLYFANDMDDRIDNCILKLKAELAEKDAIILKLSADIKNLDIKEEKTNWETSSDIYSDNEEDDDDNDSDYDPEDDEY